MVNNKYIAYIKIQVLSIGMKVPKRHSSDALVDALEQRIVEELKSNSAISQKEIAERFKGFH